MLPVITEPDLTRRRLVVVLLFAGIALRLLHGREIGSDVLSVTRSAIDYVVMGENPYGHGYLTSKPPGAPFAYGTSSMSAA